MPGPLRHDLRRVAPALRTYGRTSLESAATPAHRGVLYGGEPRAGSTGTWEPRARSSLAGGRTRRLSVGEGTHQPNARLLRLNRTTHPIAPAPAIGNRPRPPESPHIAVRATGPGFSGLLGR